MSKGTEKTSHPKITRSKKKPERKDLKENPSKTIV